MEIQASDLQTDLLGTSVHVLNFGLLKDHLALWHAQVLCYPGFYCLQHGDHLANFFPLSGIFCFPFSHMNNH